MAAPYTNEILVRECAPAVPLIQKMGPTHSLRNSAWPPTSLYLSGLNCPVKLSHLYLRGAKQERSFYCGGLSHSSRFCFHAAPHRSFLYADLA